MGRDHQAPGVVGVEGGATSPTKQSYRRKHREKVASIGQYLQK